MPDSSLLSIQDLKRKNTGAGDALLLSVPSLDLAAGSCLSVTGYSGSGKSVFLRAVADLDPTEGKICLDGVDRNHMAATTWRRQVAYVPAESGWWADQVGAHFPDMQRASSLATELGLSEDAFSWSIQRLSTGERQRLGLIRALLQQPRVLLLDEPTSGLDEQTTFRVEDVLRRRMAGGVGVVLVTHDANQRDRLATGHFQMVRGNLSPAGVAPV